VSGDTVVVGAIGEDSSATGVNGDGSDTSASNSGAAYAFSLTAPTIAPVGVTRQQGTSGSAQIATVNDSEDTAGSLVERQSLGRRHHFGPFQQRRQRDGGRRGGLYGNQRELHAAGDG
jgi:hypothetical protein